MQRLVVGDLGDRQLDRVPAHDGRWPRSGPRRGGQHPPRRGSSRARPAHRGRGPAGSRSTRPGDPTAPGPADGCAPAPSNPCRTRGGRRPSTGRSCRGRAGSPRWRAGGRSRTGHPDRRGSRPRSSRSPRDADRSARGSGRSRGRPAAPAPPPPHRSRSDGPPAGRSATVPSCVRPSDRGCRAPRSCGCRHPPAARGRRGSAPGRGASGWRPRTRRPRPRRSRPPRRWRGARCARQARWWRCGGPAGSRLAPRRSGPRAGCRGGGHRCG